jgi:hypothetical protein
MDQINGHPQVAEVEQAMTAAPADAFPTLRGIDESGHLGYEQEQFDFDLQVFIHGRERALRGA